MGAPWDGAFRGFGTRRENLDGENDGDPALLDAPGWFGDSQVTRLSRFRRAGELRRWKGWRSYSVCSVRSMMSSCVCRDSTLKNALYPATRTIRSRCFSGCACASRSVSRLTTLNCT